jgi:ribosomal-protein-alanine N-acetyltransferase
LPGIELRRLTDLSDRQLIAKIVEVEEEAFGEAGVDLYTLPPFILFEAVYALFIDGELGGVAELVRSWDTRTVLLWGFAIAPQFRGRGYGTRFLEAVLDDLPGGVEEVRLTVSPANVAARRLYESLGFEYVERVEDMYGEGEERLLMRKEIAATEGREKEGK